MSTPWIIPSDAVQAVDRFNADGPTGYKAVPPYAVNAPLRGSRTEAINDIRVSSLTGGTE